MHTKESTSTSSSPSDSELDVGTARQVYYQERGKVPGLYIRRGCTIDLVCHGYPLHRVQFPLEPELELNVVLCFMFYDLEFTL